MCTETLEHVLDVRAFVDELLRVARNWVVVTTPVGRGDDPDWLLQGEGHVRGFDRDALRRLFGPAAALASYRMNATFGLYAAVGRWLGAWLGGLFIKGDLAMAARVGSETSRLAPLRHRSFIVVVPAG